MPPKKAVVTAKPAAEFSIADWLEALQQKGYAPRNVEVKMHLRGELVPRLRYLVNEMQRLQDAPTPEGSIDDSDPLDEITAEYQKLQTEFQDGGFLSFFFRPVTKAIQNETFAEFRKRYPDEKNEDRDHLLLLRMCATCVDFPGKEMFPDGKLTVEALEAFEDTYGAAAFTTLTTGFLEAYQAGGEPGVPFSPKRSRTPDTAGSSND